VRRRAVRRRGGRSLPGQRADGDRGSGADAVGRQPPGRSAPLDRVPRGRRDRLTRPSSDEQLPCKPSGAPRRFRHGSILPGRDGRTAARQQNVAPISLPGNFAPMEVTMSFPTFTLTVLRHALNTIQCFFGIARQRDLESTSLPTQRDWARSLDLPEQPALHRIKCVERASSTPSLIRLTIRPGYKNAVRPNVDARTRKRVPSPGICAGTVLQAWRSAGFCSTSRDGVPSIACGRGVLRLRNPVASVALRARCTVAYPFRTLRGEGALHRPVEAARPA
jgi:hypothetical protein